jgi:hypothetical protein
MGSIETNVVAGYGYEVGVEVVGESGVVRLRAPRLARSSAGTTRPHSA